ncbi:MAG: response regulator [Tannerellaceae bacterium]|jgi:signal transduction histidine kinase/CheY-like chemotaxis protein|nr:response regulator [Tannerellaceae bacterium]
MLKTAKKEHIRRWVVAGYAAIITIVAVTLAYIAGVLWRMPREESRSDEPLEKAKIVSNAILLLYESEAKTLSLIASGNVDQLPDMFDGAHYQISSQLQSLRRLASDSSSLTRLNEIEYLLKEKKDNTYKLIISGRERERLMSKTFEEEMRAKRDLIKIPELQILNESQTTDTIIVQRQSKNFFRRLAEAFIPVKSDTAISVNTINTQHIDSLLRDYDPNLAVAEALIRLQNTIIVRRDALNRRLTLESRDLLANNSMITTRIHNILTDIKYEKNREVSTLEEELQVFIDRSIKDLSIIAIVSLAIILVFLSIILREINKARELRRRLEEARLKTENLLLGRERLMLMISHDIRAPLSSILSSVELLRDSNINVNQKVFVDNMSISASHTLLLVNDLLDFHRLDSGKMEINLQPYSIIALIEEIYAGFKPLADAKGLTLALEAGGISGGLRCMCDKMRISQAIGNLLSNAIKFTPRGSVTLRAATEAIAGHDSVNLSVSVIDQGPGISKLEHENIFNEFARLENSGSTEGFGLGLSISHRIITLMQGAITLDSDSGKGCCFNVILPLSVAPAETSKAPVDINRGISPSMNCLIIDDDAIQLKYAASVIKRRGVNAVSCPDPHKALSLLSIATFHLIITDIRMPGIDGRTLLNKIRTSGIKGMDAVPVAAMSSDASRSRDEFIREGFADYLTKPLSYQSLTSLLRAVFPSLSPDADTSAGDVAKAGGEVDVSAVTSYASNDEEAKMMLNLFVSETTKNVDLLHKGLKSNDRVLVSRTAHKLIPTLSMLNKTEIVDMLVTLEQNDRKMFQAIWKQTVEDCIKSIRLIVEHVKLMA